MNTRVLAHVLKIATLFALIAVPLATFAAENLSGYTSAASFASLNDKDQSPSGFVSDTNSSVANIFWCAGTNIYYGQMNLGTGSLLDQTQEILTPSVGSWDSASVCDPSVVKGPFSYQGTSYTYAMYYNGFATGQTSADIGVAFSNDLVTWTKGMIVAAPDAYGSSLVRPSAHNLNLSGPNTQNFLLFYTDTASGQTYMQSSSDGITFGNKSTISTSGLNRSSSEAPMVTLSGNPEKWYITMGVSDRGLSCPESNGLPIYGVRTYTTSDIVAGTWSLVASADDTVATNANHTPSIIGNNYGEIDSTVGTLPTLYSDGDCGQPNTWGIDIAQGSFAQTFSGSGILITSPTDQSTVSVGDNVTISFNASGLVNPFVSLSLAQNGVPSFLQLGTVNVVPGQTAYSTTWNVPTLSPGAYTLIATDGSSTNSTGFTSNVNINIQAASSTPPITIDPSQMNFDPTTDTYSCNSTCTAAQQAFFQQQVQQLGGSNSKGTNNQGSAALAVIGDALVNTAGQCAGTVLATAVAKQVGALGGVGAAQLAPLNISTNDTLRNAQKIAIAPGQGSLDAIGYCITNGLIQSLANSVTQWVNNNFQLPDNSQGSAYLKDPSAFFKNLADQTADSFIISIGGQNLCSGLGLSVQLGLLSQYQNGFGKLSCPIVDKTLQGNMSAFTSGSFLFNGGWNSWLNLTQEPSANYWGASIIATNLLGSQLASTQSQTQSDLNNGKGFLSFRKCLQPTTQKVSSGSTASAVQTGCAKWEVETPGTLIADAVIKNNDAPLDRAVVAHSFDEVVSALVSAMLKRLQNYNHS